MVKDHVASLKTDFEAQKARIEDAKLAIDGKMETLEMINVENAAEVKASFDQGFEEGLKQAGQAGGSDKIYSDEEMNAEIKPREEKIAALEAEKVVLMDEKASLALQVTDLETAKSELQASFDVMAQELAAAKEELALVKPELETVKAELAAVVADLQAKSNEVFAATKESILAGFDELKLKEQGDVEATEAMREKISTLIAPTL